MITIITTVIAAATVTKNNDNTTTTTTTTTTRVGKAASLAFINTTYIRLEESTTFRLMG